MDVSVDTLINALTAVKQANGGDGTQPVAFTTRTAGNLVLAEANEAYGTQRFLPSEDDHKSGTVFTFLFEDPA